MSNLIQTARELLGPEIEVEIGSCELCGDVMPRGEEMFRYHGVSGPCLKPPLKKKSGIKPDIRQLCQALLEAEEVIKVYHKIFPVDELPSTWLKKYSERE